MSRKRLVIKEVRSKLTSVIRIPSSYELEYKVHVVTGLVNITLEETSVNDEIEALTDNVIMLETGWNMHKLEKNDFQEVKKIRVNIADQYWIQLRDSFCCCVGVNDACDALTGLAVKSTMFFFTVYVLHIRF